MAARAQSEKIWEDYAWRLEINVAQNSFYYLDLDELVVVTTLYGLTIGEPLVIIFVTQKVAIATLWPVENNLNYGWRGL